MKRLQAMLLPLGFVLASTVSVVSAQMPADSGGKTRAQVKMETADFLKTHQWDAEREAWYMKPDVDPPAGVRSRADVKAERDAWLKVHRWDGNKAAWVSLDQPRDMSTLSREQVKAETKMYLKTHHYDETSSAWTDVK
jgi:hypothetical protein